MISRWSREVARLRRIAFDSNALVYAADGRSPYAELVAEAIDAMRTGQAIGVISTIVEMELLVKPLRDGDQDAHERVELVLRTAPNLYIRPVDRAVARGAADIRARTMLAPMDAIIASTALQERCDAIIGNDAIFAGRLKSIPYLYLEDYI